ncbi:hypothetical protein Afil01_09990 [Actinorhabdospora filicis]|uniref:Uncharacterized protein n=1 Tax=Actinorhabdospora filicis TaxID=1785913 RepID=A0A9W6W1R6_9ACTN|nr:hypothetical protein [Actinorhabdospora filicis]GLZ76192.1 hypothetical protein Afil01_09990 [Actinorhabdospora filicis]
MTESGTRTAFATALGRMTAGWSERPWAVPLICLTRDIEYRDGTRGVGTHRGLFPGEAGVHGDEGVRGDEVHNQVFSFDRPTAHAFAATGEPGEVAAKAADWLAGLPVWAV